MTMPCSSSNLSPSFNAFLFATVCDGRDEAPISVISALARLDLDPWSEAAVLASMPAAGAAERLSSLLARVADGDAALPDRETTAARLVRLLPKPGRTDVKPGAGTADVLGSPYIQSLGVMWLIILAFMALSAWVAPPPAGGGRGSASIPAATSAR